MKNDDQLKQDINGRLHSLDQTVRSVEKRLRAVERRLSVDMPVEHMLPEYEFDTGEVLENTRSEIASIRSEMQELKEGISRDTGPGNSLQEMNASIISLNTQVAELREENSRLSHEMQREHEKAPDAQQLRSLSVEMRNEISQLNIRLDKAENHNRISIGSVKVPVELSGIVGALMLALTGYLIMAGRWDIIRSAYFSFAIAIVFAAAVLIKFYVVNRKKDPGIRRMHGAQRITR